MSFRLRCSIFAIFLTLAITRAAQVSDVEKGNFGAEADTAKPNTHQNTPQKSKHSSYPFSGEIESHDAKMVTLKGKRKPRVLLITSETRILKSGSTAKLADLVSGERVSGSVRKNSEGKEEAVTISLKGPKAASK